MPKGTSKVPMIELGGQLLYDAPYHCSFCNYYYRGRGQKRVLINDWFETRNPRTREIEMVRGVIRICIANKVQSHGCVEDGLMRLFKIHRASQRPRTRTSIRSGKVRTLAA